MKRLRTSFNYLAPDGIPIMVVATATDLDYSDIEDLEIQFINLDGEIHEMEFDADFFYELEIEIHDRLMGVKLTDISYELDV